MYLPLIDILRFMASAGVMIFHYFSFGIDQNTTNLAEYLTKYGSFGVQLFFIISGIVIFNSVRRPTKEFIAGRFSRIYPIFWILCTVTYIITILFAESHLSFGLYLKNLLIVAETKCNNMVDGSYWSLTVELIFYSYIGLFAFFFKKERLKIFYILWLGITLLFYYFNLDNNIVGKLLLVRYSPYFIFGGIIGLCAQSWNNMKIIEKLNYILILIISFLSVFYISNKIENSAASATNKFGLYSSHSIPLIIAIFLVIPFSVYFSTKIKNAKFIKISGILGGITYPLYLIHQKIGEIIISKFGTIGKVSVLSIAVVIFMISISYFISIKEVSLRKRINVISLKLLSQAEIRLANIYNTIVKKPTI